MKEFWKDVLRVLAGQPPARRAQYAANYLELFDLFERNGIDVWTVKDDVFRHLRAAGVESPADTDHGVYPGKLIDALRLADRGGEDRMQAAVKLEQGRRELYLTSANGDAI